MKMNFIEWFRSINHLIVFYDQNLDKTNMINLFKKLVSDEYNVKIYKHQSSILNVSNSNHKKRNVYFSEQIVNQKLDKTVIITDNLNSLEKDKKYILLFQINLSQDSIDLLKDISQKFNPIPLYVNILPDLNYRLFNCKNTKENLSDAITSNYPKNQIVYGLGNINIQTQYEPIDDRNGIYQLKRFMNGKESLLLLNHVPIIDLKCDVLHILSSENVDEILKRVFAFEIYVYPLIDKNLISFIRTTKTINEKYQKYKLNSYKLIYEEGHYLIIE